MMLGFSISGKPAALATFEFSDSSILMAVLAHDHWLRFVIPATGFSVDFYIQNLSTCELAVEKGGFCR
jgi:hypothetical protein